MNDENDKVSYKQIIETSNKIANFLNDEIQIKKQETIAALVHNCWEFYCIHFGTSIVNGIFTAISSHFTNCGDENLDIRLQLLEQVLLVVLILARWLLPKGKISREQLSQILLAYLAMSSDIVEFFDVFKEKPVYTDETIQQIVLSAWTLSLLQFPFVLTMSRARKMRVAITDEPEIVKRRNIWSAFNDIDLWAILLANSLQDIPFLLVRLYLMVEYGLFTYTMAFFICKNALIIALQTYRAFVLFNDRYLHPRMDPRNITSLETTASEIYNKRRNIHRKPRKSITELEKMPIYNNNRRPSQQQKIYGTNNRSPSRSPHRNVYRQIKRSSIDE
uniref:AMP-dependent synthetase/ligase domain-containing protein n=1 Tax=Panagrolaimus sp. JU765 TaxID=591449 RepID=A0AC34QG94_9BILA